MKVLCDAIHADLWESLRLLFEVRFGWQLYRPIGMEWFTSGIWNFERATLGDAVARQFLEPWASDTRVTEGMLDPYAVTAEYSVRPDSSHPGQSIRLVTLEQARNQDWDLVLATLAENETGLCGFAHDNAAHYGIQVGNQGAANQWGMAEFGLLSVTTPGFVPFKPHVTYRQEFSLADFHADGGALAQPDLVSTHVQCITQTADYGLFRDLAARTPELSWRWFGHCEPRDELWGGDCPNTPAVAAQMHRARVAFHAKRWSDGYGHVVHNLAAIGRPMLATTDYYADKLAGPLFLEGVTSYSIDHHSRDELAAIVRRLATDDDTWRTMCEAMAARFAQVVSFDAEAAQIRTMLDGILSDRLVKA